jgi:LmbE family N-acetylglucosaminyl deacetylase
MRSDPGATTTSGGVLAIFAHPDDESLIAGGTLAACAAAGLEVIVLSLTCGERGPISCSEAATAATLGAVREKELQAAADALGLSTAECLTYPDGDLTSVEPSVISADLACRIRRYRPQTIITFGPEGLYWHADHIVAHEVTMAAVKRVAEDGLAPWVYWATVPQGLMEELLAAASASGVMASLWNLPPTAFGAPLASITTIIDVRPFLAAKLKALRSHRSQLAPDHLFLAVPAEVATAHLGREYFTRVQPTSVTVDRLAAIVAEGVARGRLDLQPSDSKRKPH